MGASVYVTPLSESKFRLRTYLGVDRRGRPIIKSETFNGPENEARARAREIEAAALRGELGELSPDSLGGYLDEYLRKVELEGSVELSTLRGYRHKRALIPERLERVPLVKVRARDLESMYAALIAGEGRDKSVSASTALHVHRFIHTALEAAERLGDVPRNVARSAKAPRPARRATRELDFDDDLDDERESDVETIERAAVARMLESWRVGAEGCQVNPLMFAAVAVAYKTGLRRGELCGLSWSAVDLEAREIDVRRSLFWPRKCDRPILKRPKSGRSRRVAISPETVDILRAWRAEVARIALAAGRPAPKAVFPDLDTFGPLVPDRLTGNFRRRAMRLDLPVTSFHALRHSHASELLSAGKPVHLVSRRLGHSDPATTLRVYAHCIPGSEQGLADEIDEILGRVDA